jgi:hypothetical protein
MPDDIDCPFGVTGIPTNEDRVLGKCKKDEKPCWNSKCLLDNWYGEDVTIDTFGKHCSCDNLACECKNKE